jgi:hypothetical protein
MQNDEQPDFDAQLHSSFIVHHSSFLSGE